MIWLFSVLEGPRIHKSLWDSSVPISLKDQYDSLLIWVQLTARRGRYSSVGSMHLGCAVARVLTRLPVYVSIWKRISQIHLPTQHNHLIFVRGLKKKKKKVWFSSSFHSCKLFWLALLCTLGKEFCSGSLIWVVSGFCGAAQFKIQVEWLYQ